MKSLYFRILFFMLLAIGAAGCSSDSKHNDEPDPIPTSAKRTVLVYMVADNNLGVSYQLDNADLNEMLAAARAGDIGEGRLVIYHNRPGTDRGNVPQLIEVTPEGIKTLKDYPDDREVYSVEIQRMRDVLNDVKTLAPGDCYGLVLWGHSKGWMTEKTDLVDRSYGTDRGKWMTLGSLRKALEGENFDFIYLDCCLMGSVECAYELRKSASVIVGSPTEVEGEGMPYQLNVKPFFAKDADMVAAARNTYEYHSQGGRHCQMVVVNTAGLDELASASRAIYATVDKFPDGLSGLQHLSQRFDYGSSLYSDCRPVSDFESYMKLLGASHPDLVKRWQEAYDRCISYKATTPREFTGIEVKTYGGLGAFIIKRASDATYRGYAETLWWKDAASAMPACAVE